jgi:hypothetical protein
MIITVDRLKELGACGPQLDKFAALYPSGIEVTQENATAALKSGLNIEWLIKQLKPDVNYHAGVIERMRAARQAAPDKKHDELMQDYLSLESKAIAEILGE